MPNRAYNIPQIQNLINETIKPALFEDFKFESVEEAEKIKRILIEQIQKIDMSDFIVCEDDDEDVWDIDDLESDLD